MECGRHTEGENERSVYSEQSEAKIREEKDAESEGGGEEGGVVL